MLTDTQSKHILSLNSAGRVREYELVRTFAFQVTDPAGQSLIPRSQIVMRRDITFNDDQVLSKEARKPCSGATCRLTCCNSCCDVCPQQNSSPDRKPNKHAIAAGTACRASAEAASAALCRPW